ncbi:MAG: dethiobiotin synthase [Proteobacteria bacterium]|nr:dethiobiotin synthase [Pseudomonadota bacterium]
MKVFITGTDTDIGKTYISCLMLKNWNSRGFKTIGLKPISSGCEGIDKHYINRDAHLLQHTASIRLTYEQVNPYCFIPPVSPHIVAEKERVKLTVQEICSHIQKISQITHNRMIVEGVGGLMVPLNKEELQLDLMKALNFPVVFVIGLKLGCLNHALLSIAVLKAHQIPIKGWVINHIDPYMACAHENITTLKYYLKNIPYLGYVPFEGVELFKDNVSP